MKAKTFRKALVKVFCADMAEHCVSFAVDNLTLKEGGWGKWTREGHYVYGYLQSGKCCNLPIVTHNQRY